MAQSVFLKQYEKNKNRAVLNAKQDDLTSIVQTKCVTSAVQCMQLEGDNEACDIAAHNKRATEEIANNGL